jgi:hypothetical protein
MLHYRSVEQVVFESRELSAVFGKLNSFCGSCVTACLLSQVPGTAARRQEAFMPKSLYADEIGW